MAGRMRDADSVPDRRDVRLIPARELPQYPEWYEGSTLGAAVSLCTFRPLDYAPSTVQAEPIACDLELEHETIAQADRSVLHIEEFVVVCRIPISVSCVRSE